MNNECLDALIHDNEIDVLRFQWQYDCDHDEPSLINA